MNFDFSNEQKQLKESARRFLERACPPACVRGVLESDASHDSVLWQGLAEMGFTGAAIPEEFGGLGLGYLELCVIAEELGRALAPVPFSSSIYLFAELIKQAGNLTQKTARLPPIAIGSSIGTFAAADAETILKTPPCWVRNGLLSGRQLLVPDASVADVAVVLAREDNADGPQSLFIVALGDPGVSRQSIATLDPSRKSATLILDSVPAEPLGPAGAGAAIVSEAVDRAAVLIAFEQIGGAERAMEMARDYALQRIAFGRPIGSFQAIKHRLADMYVALTLARSNAYYAAWALETGAPDLAIAAATARVSATDAFRLCATENIQIHGGIGFTWAANPHLFYRRAHLLGLALGAPSVWEAKLVDRLYARQAA